MKTGAFHEGFLLVEEVINKRSPSNYRHNYFQILYIKYGKGIITINEIEVLYNEGSIFLIAPEDDYYINPNSQTCYTAFKFTEILFSSKSSLPDREHWLHNIEHILHNPNIMPRECQLSHDDRKRLWRIHDFIIDEYKSKDEFYWSIITNAITTTLSILARSIIKTYNPNDVKPTLNLKKTDQILSYIRTHVYEPELVKIEHLAAKFNMSPANIVALFKKETGESIRQYIINYKLMLVKYRLKNTNYTISEISYELGFTDESHLTKSFKKRFNKTPKEYRKELVEHS
ncbi:AraC family transcriptional regulator [Galbibacter sp. PAP.153]|uniref:AraC family transcriptional regulator n=1 Tax=Galbibacter sp. PAP.153 TaxID=3104623 RepID=UPI00300962E5